MKQVMVIKERDGDVLTSEESELIRMKSTFIR